MNIKRALYFLLVMSIAISSLLSFNTQSLALENNDVGICETIESYMQGRLDVLAGDEMLGLASVAVSGIVRDELYHKEILEQEKMSIFYSEYVITDIKFSELEVYVSLLETMTYINNRITTVDEVNHTIVMIESSTQGWVILSDRYYEETTDFASCSYVPENTTYNLKRSATYSLEIVNVASGEIGYLEKETNASLDDKTANAGNKNFTKYGEWYGCNGKNWCAIFVSWCAKQAEVSNCVIPKYANCDTGMQAFKDKGWFFLRGSVEPQEGDIFFKGTEEDAYHTGIVAAINGEQMYIIHGNTGINSTTEGVKGEWVNKNDSIYVGFARPAYSLTHHYVLKYNISYHWQQCTGCERIISKKTHTYSKLGKCTTCGATQASTAMLKINNLVEASVKFY